MLCGLGEALEHAQGVGKKPSTLEIGREIQFAVSISLSGSADTG